MPPKNHPKRTQSAFIEQKQIVALCVAALAAILLLWFLLPSQQKDGIVVYTALDEGFSQPIFQAFTKKTGLNVVPKFDTESTKSVGLTQAILAEKARPRCDLFWNNEILNTIRLERAGLLRPFQTSAADHFPDFAKSPKQTWYGFAARARVLLVNTKLLPNKKEWPNSVDDLAARKWKGICGIAKPLFGTTATHMAVLFEQRGAEAACGFLHNVKHNAVVLGGNRRVAAAVALGQIAWGLTDTDDALGEIERGMPVAIVYPDQAEGQPGTLFIPNTLSLMKGSPHAAEAEKLLEYLLSPAVEKKLALGKSAQIPLNPNVTVALRVESPQTIRAAEVDWYAAADQWNAARAFLLETFASGE